MMFMKSVFILGKKVSRQHTHAVMTLLFIICITFDLWHIVIQIAPSNKCMRKYFESNLNLVEFQGISTSIDL